MVYSDTEIAAFILQYFLPFVRIGAMFMAMPIIGAQIVSARVRLVMAFLVAMIVTPMLPALPVLEGLSLHTLILVMQEVLIGVAVGFAFQIVFQVFVLSGQIMAMKMGLGFASMNDPTNGVQTTALSQFYLMLVTLMFVAINGHLVLITMIVESFRSLPPGNIVISPQMFIELAGLASWMFASALVISLPVLTSLLFVNMAFGVMSRAAPQLNIFAVGFPFTLICGLLLVWLGLTNFSTNFENTMDYGFIFINDLLRVR